jgi:hypothetical protein
VLTFPNHYCMYLKIRDQSQIWQTFVSNALFIPRSTTRSHFYKYWEIVQISLWWCIKQIRERCTNWKLCIATSSIVRTKPNSPWFLSRWFGIVQDFHRCIRKIFTFTVNSIKISLYLEHLLLLTSLHFIKTKYILRKLLFTSDSQWNTWA